LIGVIHEGTAVGIAENSSHNGIRVFPNPLSAGEGIHIISEENIEAVELIDSKGQVLSKTVFNENLMNDLLPGVYFLRIYTQNNCVTKRVLILARS
jgi:hypothetical protein